MSLPQPIIFGRRAQGLITFIGSAIKSAPTGTPPVSPPNKVSITDLVRLLIEVATVQAGSLPESPIEHLSNAASSSLNKTLEVMMATDFIAAVLVMLETGEYRVSRLHPCMLLLSLM